MAVKRSKAKSTEFATDEAGNPDIFVLVNDQGMSMIEAAEATELSIAEVHRLLWAQEVEHDPTLEIDAEQDEKKLGRVLAKEKDNGVRWERLMARSGLSKARIMELVAEAKGVEPDDLKRPMGKQSAEGDEEEGEEEKPASRKPARKTTRKAAAPPPEEEEAEEEADEEETPAARRPRRRKARA